MPLSAVRSSPGMQASGSSPDVYSGAPMFGASASVSGSGSTQATGVLVLLLIAVIVVGERWLR